MASPSSNKSELKLKILYNSCSLLLAARARNSLDQQLFIRQRKITLENLSHFSSLAPHTYGDNRVVGNIDKQGTVSMR